MLGLASVLSLFGLFGLVGTFAGCRRPPQGKPLADPRLEHGRQIYLADCEPCHGPGGHGDGVVAKSQPVPPRDFVSCGFKYSSGPPGSLPSDDDLFHTVTFGVATSTMPSFATLPESDRRAVIAYVKTFCARFGGTS